MNEREANEYVQALVSGTKKLDPASILEVAALEKFVELGDETAKLSQKLQQAQALAKGLEAELQRMTGRHDAFGQILATAEEQRVKAIQDRLKAISGKKDGVTPEELADALGAERVEVVSLKEGPCKS